MFGVSHPLRVRGLKLLKAWWSPDKVQSHPLRVRGLKPTISLTPLVTQGRILYGCVDWNLGHFQHRTSDRGRILYGCVDWNTRSHWRQPCSYHVASFTGAWIETRIWGISSVVERSHPLRVRGLKRFWAGGATPTNGSHPLRVRGLKLTLDKSVKNTF